MATEERVRVDKIAHLCYNYPCLGNTKAALVAVWQSIQTGYNLLLTPQARVAAFPRQEPQTLRGVFLFRDKPMSRKRIYTQEQKEAHNKASQKLRKFRIANKLCRDCGISLVTGLQLCDDCRKRNSRRLIQKHRKNPAYSLWRNAMNRAKRLNIPFELNVNDIIVPDKCPVLGIPLIVGDEKLNDNSPTIDQIFPGLGYTPKNIRVISYRANSIKRDATAAELEKVLIYMQRAMI